MAKAKQIIEDNALNEGELEQTGATEIIDSETAGSEEETLAAEDAAIKEARMAREVKQTPGTKNVKVQIVEAVDCIVAGVPYKLAKDKSFSVPSDVAAILVNSRKAYRI